jgi:hypothetical protein
MKQKPLDTIIRDRGMMNIFRSKRHQRDFPI